MEENIVLYSTGCPKCKILKKKLQEKNIQYVENNSVDEMLKLGFGSVPVLQVGNTYMNFVSANAWLNQQKDMVI